MEETASVSNPGWLLPRGGLDEIRFCRDFMLRHYIVYWEGAFFSPDGRITKEDTLRGQIFRELEPWVSSDISAKVERLLGCMRVVCAQNCLEPKAEEDAFTVPVANGTYRMGEGFIEVKHLTRYRLPVKYNPNAGKPERWLRFVEELLHGEDIPTLQEYMGYCLIPCTLGQKMLIITGKGGEGKSRLGIVMKQLLGDNMNVGSIAKVEKSPFARADLQHLLLMVDDDLKMEALDQTNYLKSIITAELPMDLERKGIQSYQGLLNVRFMAFGNGSLQALHDRSYGFFRRQILLEARERPADRVDDPWLSFSLKRETEGILLWALEGLQRLVANDFRFTQSKRARDNLLRSMAQSNNVLEFLRSEGYIRFDSNASTTSRVLYETYRTWCFDNAMNPLGHNSFSAFLAQNQETYGLCPTKHVSIGGGKTARGFRGIRVITPP